MIVKKQAGATVGFGSRSRRPIGETSIKEIAEYSYIPDIRQINAISTMQMKEQRSQMVQQMAAAAVRNRSVTNQNTTNSKQTLESTLL